MSKFDVFISHNSADKPAVRELKRVLAERGIVAWLDEDELRPGVPWIDLLEQGVRSSRSVIVCVATDGLGPWENEEMQAALRLAVKDRRPLIPVLLPDAPSQPKLPLFLANRTWVDLHSEPYHRGIERLIWGITGKKPKSPLEIPATPSERPAQPEDQTIRLLHLSDFHFRKNKTWDSDQVLRKLARCISEEVKAGLEPDLVIVTGDLAYSGQPEEYQIAKTWLEQQLWPALPVGFPRNRLLLVSGNHDVDRRLVGRGVRFTQEGLLAERSQDAIAELLDDEDVRRAMLKRHQAYLAFFSEWLEEDQPLPWWQRTIEIRGHGLHFAGLNSAWMACSDQDRGRLLLGRWQLSQTVITKEAEKADLRIALLHHPWDYLAEFDAGEARRSIHQHCDLLLRGHLHETLSERILPPDPTRTCLELAAGCVYESSTYPNAFQWIELRPSVGGMRVLFRAWLHGTWTIDRNQPGCPEGWAEFELPGMAKSAPAVRASAPALRASAPQVPPEYLTWVRNHYASVELLGQDTHQGQAITLHHVYVPAVTESKHSERASSRPEESEEHRPDLLLERLGARSLYVPGAPGSGKSTFCRWAVLQADPRAHADHPVPAPEGFAEPTSGPLRGRLPLLVPLREFWKTMDNGQGRSTWLKTELEQALEDWIEQAPPPALSGDLLRDHLEAGSAFLLLDGLDEVPESESRDGITLYPRSLILTGLTDAIPSWEQDGNRILLTSRPYGLDEAGLARLGLDTAPLEPLPSKLQELFIERWFHTLAKPELSEGLKETIRWREDLLALTANPLLLTTLCVIYGSGRRVPEDRYHLYRSIVDSVLYLRYPGDISQRELVMARLEAVAFGMHTGKEIGESRTSPAFEVTQSEVQRTLQVFAELNPAYESGRVQPVAQREELLTRSGLLLPRSDGRAAFYHRSLQDFLAAERIAHTQWDPKALELVFRERSMVPEWRATLVFLFADRVFNYRNPTWGLELLEHLAADQKRESVKRDPARVIFLAEALELCLAKNYVVPDELANTFRTICLASIEDEIEIQARQSLGMCLGRLGDPRIKDMRDPTAYAEVPAGEYAYGEKGAKVTIEQPFLLGCYPVTNDQYAAFMSGAGYSNRLWWSDAGWEWLQEEGIERPLFWREQTWNGPNQPVVGVSFWEAEACCAWAGGRLPTEHEWEAAARGAEGCENPWCGKWEDGICNSKQAGLRTTSPVGLFPRARQVELGLDDLVGNVWEWCSDETRDWQDRPERVLCGGAFSNAPSYMRSSSRDRVHPEYRVRAIGFRCVLVSPALQELRTMS